MEDCESVGDGINLLSANPSHTQQRQKLTPAVIFSADAESHVKIINIIGSAEFSTR